MAVKIRLARRGRKKLAIYDVVVADARSPRDGRYIEKLGTFNPNFHPYQLDIDADKTVDWLLKGATPTDTARNLLSSQGIMLRKHLQVGVLKGAISQEDADKKFEAWLKEKEQKNIALADKIRKQIDQERKARLEAESKVKDAKAAELRKKQEAAVSETAEGEEVPEAQTAEEQPQVAEAVEAEEAAVAEKADEEITEPVSEKVEEPADETASEVTSGETEEDQPSPADTVVEDQTSDQDQVQEAEAEQEKSMPSQEAAADKEQASPEASADTDQPSDDVTEATEEKPDEKKEDKK
jgi:small subunit ribosomal protein S16